MPDIDGIVIKGYFTDTGYMGHIGNGKYMLFADETDYLDYMEVMYWWIDKIKYWQRGIKYVRTDSTNTNLKSDNANE